MPDDTIELNWVRQALDSLVRNRGTLELTTANEARYETLCEEERRLLASIKAAHPSNGAQNGTGADDRRASTS